eukprot:2833243-Prymnesium_polylepis.2
MSRSAGADRCEGAAGSTDVGRVGSSDALNEAVRRSARAVSVAAHAAPRPGGERGVRGARSHTPPQIERRVEPTAMAASSAAAIVRPLLGADGAPLPIAEADAVPRSRNANHFFCRKAKRQRNW